MRRHQLALVTCQYTWLMQNGRRAVLGLIVILQEAAYSLWKKAGCIPYRPTWTHPRPENSKQPPGQRDQPAQCVRSGPASAQAGTFRQRLQLGLEWRNFVDRIPHMTPLFHFSAIQWACPRDYNCCVLLCICYYKSNNGRSSPTEPALYSILLWVWRIGSNYGYKGESWQTWLKMDAKIQLSVV